VRIIGKFARDRRGATVVEYGLICAMIILAIMVSIHTVSTLAVNMLYNVSNHVDNASNS
jgi:pilus assembly protein Flp/PilA